MSAIRGISFVSWGRQRCLALPDLPHQRVHIGKVPDLGELAAFEAIKSELEENITEVEGLAADPSSTVDDVLAVIVEQITTSAVFVAMVNPSGTDDPRVGEVAVRLMSLVADKLDDPSQRGSLRADVTASDVFMAVAMLAAILLKTDGRSKRRVAQQAWALLERGLTR